MRLLAALLLLVLAACAPPPAAPPLAEPTAELEEALLESLARQARAYNSLEGVAKVRVLSSGRNFGATQILLAEKPDHLRAETLSPFGQPMLLMATDGEEMTVMIPSRGDFYRDRASPENLQRFTRVPLRLEDLVHILLYQVPVIGHDRRTLVAEEGLYLLTLLDAESDRRQELRFDGRMNLLETAYFIAEESQLHIRFSEFPEGESDFPRRIALRMPALEAEASLDFSELRTNVAIPEERFLLDPPPGVPVLPIPPPRPDGG